MSAKDSKKEVTYVVRVLSEAERERTIECAQRYSVTAFLVDDVPKKLLPKTMEYLGYVFLRGTPTQMKEFTMYINSINTLAKNWSL